MKLILFGIFFFLLSINSAYSYTIRHDLGGSIGEYEYSFRAAARSGEKIIIDGKCVSACTLALRYPNVCVTSRSILGFHSATPDPHLTGIPPEIVKKGLQRGTELMWTAIPLEIRRHLHPLSHHMQYIRGYELPKRYRCH